MGKQREGQTGRLGLMYTHVCMLSQVWLLVTPWTVALQAPLSMRFFKQEYWSGLPSPPPALFLTQGSKPCVLCFPHWQVNSLPVSHLGSPDIYTLLYIK